MTRAVLFDFDFTLADSAAGVMECVQFALGSLGFEMADPDAVRRSVGLSLPDALKALTGREDRALSVEFSRLFLERADEVIVSATSLYPESPYVLKTLRERGVSTSIVSTKVRYRIEAILAAAGLDGAVDVIVGGEDVAQHKPHPAGLQQALSRLGAGPSSALYVGDHPVDGLAAQNAGIRFVRVLSGADHAADGWASIDTYATLENVGGVPNLPELLAK